MTWHYQAFKVIPKKGTSYFCVKEVYEDIPKKGKQMWTEHPMEPISEEGKKGLLKVLKMMINDVQKYPVKEEKLKK